MNATVDETMTLAQRRTLRFETIDAVLADLDQLADAEVRTTLKTIGNWSSGQIFGHVAQWVEWSYGGLPLKVPFIIRLMLRPMKGRVLNKPMRAGGKIPRVPGGTLATEVIPFDEGLERLRRAFVRLRQEPPVGRHAIFGILTHDEWIRLHLRHAELHLSFLVAD